MDTFFQLLSELMENISLFLDQLSALDMDTWMRLGLLYVLFLWCAIIVWAIRDISARGGGFLWQLIVVLLIIFLTPIFGLPLYFLIRPQYRYYEEEVTPMESAHVCPEEHSATLVCYACKKPVDVDFIFCPYCKTHLKESCAKCQQEVRTEWKICPYCGTRDFHEKETEKEEKPTKEEKETEKK